MNVIYPGSFDPITKGHLNIIERASKRFDQVCVAVVLTSSKPVLFGAQVRKKMIDHETRSLKNVTVEIFDGLLIDFARKKKCFNVLRGVRGASDFDFEATLSLANQSLEPRLETFLMVANPAFFHVSASLMKEVARHEGDLHTFTTQNVAKELKKKL